ncbi:hypothetical protein [Geothrix oryzae]|uniref:hypothetical protein n=1 Tax=Geothrix oryzae TaxID=2927975 RepID=UPI002573A29C|nr:hypothetical protein [Geothrix oryzae]
MPMPVVIWRLRDGLPLETVRVVHAAFQDRLGEGLLVDLLEAVLVHLLLNDERGAAPIGDQAPAYHLADDHLDVLIADDHTLGR